MITLPLVSRQEVSLWKDIAKQHLYVRALGRRWYVTEINWRSSYGFVANVTLQCLVEI